MVPVLEAVPNFSEGRDLDLVRELVSVVAAEGVDVLDWSADPDHHRSVLTYVGDPEAVERASLAAAAFALERIDLRDHAGVHPRIGALDVLPFVPLRGLDLSDAARVARRVGAGIADLGVPVYWYGHGAPAGRSLSDIRRGGFDTLREGVPADRAPDLDAGRGGSLHPTAGATCVGARRLLLAWNVYVEGVPLEALRRVASDLRERGPDAPGGRRFRGLRALAFELPAAGRSQISMNLEDLEATSPFDVYRAIEARAEAEGGRVSGTEVIGMIPDPLVLPAATDRLQLLDSHPSRLLSARLADHLSIRAGRSIEALRRAVEEAGEACPSAVRAAVERFLEASRITPTAGDDP